MSDLSPELVVAAYARGYFPMAEPGSGRVGWFRPERRAIFLPGDARCSHSLRRTIRQGRFQIEFDRSFAAVMRCCAARAETWISDEILDVYVALHRSGLAHSVEAYRGERLAGGLYGVALGGAFFGESMFHLEADASKVAFAALVQRLDERGYLLHDAQFMTPHLASLGAREVSGRDYLRYLHGALSRRCRFS
jgi:leucyl/phenylalanyl-tRNA--protein transferase